jgi:hypothetical protein
MQRAKTQAQQEILTEKFKKLSDVENTNASKFNPFILGSGDSKTNEQIKKMEILKIKEEIDVLGRQMAGDQIQSVGTNPESISATDKKGQTITIDFKNAPEWLNVSETGNSVAKISNLKGFSMSSTR